MKYLRTIGGLFVYSIGIIMLGMMTFIVVLGFNFLILKLSLMNPSVFSAASVTYKLEDLDPKLYKLAREISSNELFTKGKVNFLVGRFNGLSFLGISLASYNNTVVLSYYELDSKYIDVIIAHELGHLENDHVRLWTKDPQRDQIEANEFAAKIFGKEKVKEWLISLGLKKNDPMVTALSN